MLLVLLSFSPFLRLFFLILSILLPLKNLGLDYLIDL